ncbi:hypothetical protein Tco_0933983, partial [Tanacetum coccineum]
VFENDVKGSTASSSSTQNVTFVSENTSSTNDVSTACGVSNPSEQLDEFGLEEMDLKWQVAIISMRMKKFYKNTGRMLQFDAKEPKSSVTIVTRQGILLETVEPREIKIIRREILGMEITVVILVRDRCPRGKGNLPSQNALEILEFFKINEWQARLDAKDVSVANLRKHIESLKGKNVVEKDVRMNNPNVIAPEIFKLDLAPLAPKLLNNRDAPIDYIKHSREHDETLWEIVEHARALRPLDSDLDYACKIVQQIQEVLVYVRDSSPSLTKL